MTNNTTTDRYLTAGRDRTRAARKAARRTRAGMVGHPLPDGSGRVALAAAVEPAMTEQQHARADHAAELGRLADAIHADYRRAADEANRLKTAHNAAMADYIEARGRIYRADARPAA